MLILSRPTRSIYALTRKEITKGLANRFVHSRTYIFLYLGMAALSVTTIVLSVTDGCPGLAFYILEIIINTSMIVEVAIRFVAFGRVSLTFLRVASPFDKIRGSNFGSRHSMSLTLYLPYSALSLYWFLLSQSAAPRAKRRRYLTLCSSLLGMSYSSADWQP